MTELDSRSTVALDHTNAEANSTGAENGVQCPSSVQLKLEEHKALCSIISHIMEEFWQTNAFFVSFFGVVIGAMIAQSNDLVAKIGPILRLALLVLLLVLTGVWVISLLRHLHYSQIHLDHALDIERSGLGIRIYTRRLAEIKKVRCPSARIAWLSVPILVAAVLITLFVTFAV